MYRRALVSFLCVSPPIALEYAASGGGCVLRLGISRSPAAAPTPQHPPPSSLPLFPPTFSLRRRSRPTPTALGRRSPHGGAQKRPPLLARPRKSSGSGSSVRRGGGGGGEALVRPGSGGSSVRRGERSGSGGSSVRRGGGGGEGSEALLEAAHELGDVRILVRHLLTMP